MTNWVVEPEAEEEAGVVDSDDAPLLVAPLDPMLEAPVEDDPFPEDDPLPDTCCPTERLTDATVPAMVEARLASASDAWAEVSWAWDDGPGQWSVEYPDCR